MPVVTLYDEFSFDVAAIDDEVIESEVRRRKQVHDRLKQDWRDSLDPPSPYEFTTAELVTVLENRGVDITPWAERLYRLIATGETDEALDLLYREAPEGLAPPVYREAHRRTSHRPEGLHPC